MDQSQLNIHITPTFQRLALADENAEGPITDLIQSFSADLYNNADEKGIFLKTYGMPFIHAGIQEQNQNRILFFNDAAVAFRPGEELPFGYAMIEELERNEIITAEQASLLKQGLSLIVGEDHGMENEWNSLEWETIDTGKLLKSIYKQLLLNVRVMKSSKIDRADFFEKNVFLDESVIPSTVKSKVIRVEFSTKSLIQLVVGFQEALPELFPEEGIDTDWLVKNQVSLKSLIYLKDDGEIPEVYLDVCFQDTSGSTQNFMLHMDAFLAGETTELEIGIEYYSQCALQYKQIVYAQTVSDFSNKQKIDGFTKIQPTKLSSIYIPFSMEAEKRDEYILLEGNVDICSDQECAPWITIAVTSDQSSVVSKKTFDRVVFLADEYKAE